MSFHESYHNAKFLMGCFSSLVLGVIFLVTPGVDHWRAIPAFVFSGLLFWISFKTQNSNIDPTIRSDESNEDGTTV